MESDDSVEQMQLMAGMYKSLIKDKVLAEAADSLTATLRAIIQITFDGKSASEIYGEIHKQVTADRLYILWETIFSLVRAAPQPYSGLNKPNATNTAYLEKIVSLIDAIRTASAFIPDLSSPAAQYLTTLAGFAMVSRAQFNVTPGIILQSSQAQISITTEEWTNLNTFLALLWRRCTPASNFTEPSQYCYDLYAIWSLRETLETQHENDILVLPALMPAAASWIYFNRDAIRFNHRQWPPSPRFGAPARPGPFFAASLEQQQGSVSNEKNGFSDARWEFWRARLGEIECQEDLDGGSRGIARELGMVMDRDKS